jgi:SAM-dependent methyltransferase
MPTVPDRTRFETMYAGGAPWDIGRPQKAFIDAAEEISGSVLDAGCGTGDIALFVAGRGNRVTGIDFLEEPIKRARCKAAERGLSVTFIVKDAMTLKDWSERFDNVIDSGLFHVFSDEDRKKYPAGLATILKPGGRLFLMCFSDEEPGTEGPRRVSKSELQDAFTHGWEIESIQRRRFEVRPDLMDFTFSEVRRPGSWSSAGRDESAYAARSGHAGLLVVTSDCPAITGTVLHPVTYISLGPRAAVPPAAVQL